MRVVPTVSVISTLLSTFSIQCLLGLRVSACPGSGGGLDLEVMTRPSPSDSGSRGHNVNGLARNP